MLVVHQGKQSKPPSSTLHVNSLQNSAQHPLTKQENRGSILMENRNSHESKIGPLKKPASTNTWLFKFEHSGDPSLASAKVC